MTSFRKSVLYLSIIVPSVLMGEFWFAGGYISADYSIGQEYTTNVQGRSDSEEDFITTFSPGITYTTEIAMLELGTRIGYNFERYEELSELDSNNLDIQLFTSVQENSDAAFSIDDISLTAAENTQRNPELGQIIRSRDYDASISLSYRPSRLYSISSGIGYNRTDPLSGNLNKTEGYDIPIDLYYRHSEALSYGIGYRMSQEDSSGNNLGNISITSHSLYGFASGTIFPSVSGSLQLGAQKQETTSADREEVEVPVSVIVDESDNLQVDYRIGNNQDGNSDIAPYISGNLTWLISSATSCNLGVSTDFDTTSTGQSNQGYGANIGLSHTLSTTLSGTLLISFEQTEFSGNEFFIRRRIYEEFTIEDDEITFLGPVVDDFLVETISQNRDDTTWIFATGLNKQIGRNTNLNVNLSYTESNSSEDLFSYDEISFSFNIAQRF